MSRSYRKPYATWTGSYSSAHEDKTIAARGVRRRQNQYLKEVIKDRDFDSFLIPDMHECSYNEVWTWGRDGKKKLMMPYPRFRGRMEKRDKNMEEHYKEFYIKIQRK